jgi:hypothetical protein
MRIYKSYPQAFLFQIAVASLTLISISLWGIKGFLVIALFGLRPLILEKVERDVDKTFWMKHYNVGKISIALTFVTLLIIYFILDLFGGTKNYYDYLLKLFIPYFLLIHGVIGSLVYKYK